MSTAVKLQPVPAAASLSVKRPLYRLSVEQYEKMVEAGVLKSGERVELIDGLLLQKMTQHPPHATSVEATTEALRAVLLEGWVVRDRKPIRLATSEPEPDVTVARGPRRLYEERHPRPADIAALVEVADSSLDEDRSDKNAMYARARIAVYWIVNLVHAQVEVYTDPRAGRNPGYRLRHDYRIGEDVPVVVDGREVGRIPVRDLLPSTLVGESE
jgi:Uma2 family endonuclease